MISFTEYLQQLEEARTWGQWARGVAAPVAGLAASLLAPGMQNQAAAQDVKKIPSKVSDLMGEKVDFKQLADKAFDSLSADPSKLGKNGYATGTFGDYTMHFFNMDHPTIVVKSSNPQIQQRNILTGIRRAEAKVINNSGKQPVYKTNNGKIMIFFTRN